MGNLFRRTNVQDNQQSLAQITTGAKKVEIRLRKGVTKIEQKELMDRNDLKHLFSQQSWCIDFDKQQLHYPHTLSLIQSCQGVITLSISYQSSSLFLLYIQPIMFPHLQKLNLNNCQIASIHQVVILFSPNLRQLSLKGNQITSIKPLLKIISNLEILNLTQNYIQDLSFLTQVNFAKISLAINLEQTKSRSYGEFVNWLVKLPFEQIQRIEIDGKGRIGVEKSFTKTVRQVYKGENQVFLWGPSIKVNRVKEQQFFQRQF